MSVTYIETRDVPIGKLTRYPGNARRGDIEAIRASIRRHGQYRALVVRDTSDQLVILAGNHTYDALQAEGHTVVRAEILTCDDADGQRINLADNRLAELGGYDDQALAELLESLDGDYDGTGYDEEDLNALLAGVQELPAALTDPDDVPEAPTEPFSKPGDLWRLGPHWLLCGDSTDPESWNRLLGNQRPKLVFTDPPYGIGYQAMRGGSAIANDANANEALQVTKDALALLHDAETHFVCCDWRSLATIIEAMLYASIEPKATIVWDKQSRVQNLDRYAKQHEFIVYSGPYGGMPTQCTDVWVHQRDFEPDHPTPKPVSLVTQALMTASDVGDIVADAFGGSGTTLIAAHVTGRIARVVELDPRYVDVICRRYQEHAGDLPVLAATGEQHDFTRESANQ
jgi:site-specific DNA-methyltransferase (adenine-specific)